MGLWPRSALNWSSLQVCQAVGRGGRACSAQDEALEDTPILSACHSDLARVKPRPHRVRVSAEGCSAGKLSSQPWRQPPGQWSSRARSPDPDRWEPEGPANSAGSAPAPAQLPVPRWELPVHVWANSNGSAHTRSVWLAPPAAFLAQGIRLSPWILRLLPDQRWARAASQGHSLWSRGLGS